ncbi:MAG: hypothetical protein HY710_06840 [Candidatus Latescibacteria bacterium]|nr:hypothetical protein [Candidatus Latescibacterota bacterium]
MTRSPRGRLLLTGWFWVIGLLLVPPVVAAGAWTLPKGQAWVKESVFYQSTDQQFCTGNLAFCRAHDRAPFNPFTGGRSRALALFTDVAYGATDWLEIGVQVPFYSLEFRDRANPTRPRTQKVGDIRLYAKYRVSTHPVVTSVRVGVKTPTGGVNVDAEVVPVGEGQWDIEGIGEIGRSFSVLPGYANVAVGYRRRRTNTRFAHKPGDELTLLGELGWQVTRRVTGKGMIDYLYSGHPRSLGFTFTRERRELLTVAPAVLVTPVHRLTVEGMVRLPVRGQDVPAGPQYSVGVSYTFDLARIVHRASEIP